MITWPNVFLCLAGLLLGFFLSIAVLTALDLVGVIDIIAWHCN